MPRTLTAKGTEMLGSIPVRFREDPDVDAVLTCYGREAERLAATRDTVTGGLISPELADERMLPLWERLLQVPVPPANVTLLARQQSAAAYLLALRQSGTGSWWERTVDRIVKAAESNLLLEADFEDTPLGTLIPQDDGTGLRVPYGGAWGISTDGTDGAFDFADVVLHNEPTWQQTPVKALHVQTSASGGVYLVQTVGVGPAAVYRVRLRTKIIQQSGAGNIELFLHWYRADGTTSISTLTGTSFTTVGEHVYDALVTAPALAGVCRVYVHMNDTSGFLEAFVDDVYFGPEGPWSYLENVPDPQPVNLLTDPRMTATANWTTSTTGSATVAASLATDLDLDKRGIQYVVTPPGSGAFTFSLFTAGAAIGPAGAVAAGDWVGVRLRVKVLDGPIPHANGMIVGVSVKTAALGSLTVFTAATVAAATPTPDGTILELVGKVQLTAALVPTASRVGLELDIQSTAGDSHAPYTIVVGRAMIVKLVDGNAPVPVYWNSATAGTWSGTPDASTSTRVVPAVGHVRVDLPFATGTAELGKVTTLIQRITDSHLVLDVHAAT